MAVVKRVGVWSLAKIGAAIAGTIGLVAGIGYAIGYAVSPQTMMGGIGMMPWEPGYWSVLLFPIVSALRGLIAGIIVGWLYNLFAPSLGGVRLDLEVAGSSETATARKKR